MNDFLNFLMHFVFISTFSFLYVVSILLLKPFRVHKIRPASTLSLKISYLIYLLVFLVLSYVVLFYSGLQGNFDDISYDSRYNMYYLAIIISFLVPNLAIMFRRRVKKYRTPYNFVFTGVNLIITLVLLIIMNVAL